MYLTFNIGIVVKLCNQWRQLELFIYFVKFVEVLWTVWTYNPISVPVTHAAVNNYVIVGPMCCNINAAVSVCLSVMLFVYNSCCKWLCPFHSFW